VEEKLDRDAPLRVASANVHSKVFDDEVIVLDMKSGTYFSLRGSGVDVWKLIEANASAASISETLEGRYDGADDEIATAVDSLLDELAASALIVADPSLDPSSPISGAGERVRFAAPQVERFTDMQELLLLDPIHEVDDAGWPHTPMTR
jgi:hypothetical protein